MAVSHGACNYNIQLATKFQGIYLGSGHCFLFSLVSYQMLLDGPGSRVTKCIERYVRIGTVAMKYPPYWLPWKFNMCMLHCMCFLGSRALWFESWAICCGSYHCGNSHETLLVIWAKSACRCQPVEAFVVIRLFALLCKTLTAQDLHW